MSNLVQSHAKQGVSTSHALQWPRRLLFVPTMVLVLSISQSVAATPFAGAELNLISADFNHRGGQGGPVDALKNTPELKTGGNILGAEYGSNAELGYRLTLHSSDPAQSIPFDILVFRRIQGARNVIDGQVSNNQQEPVALTMTKFKIGAAKTKGCMPTFESYMHRAKWRAIDVGQVEYNRER